MKVPDSPVTKAKFRLATGVVALYMLKHLHGNIGMPSDLDAIDLKILTLLQHDASLSTAEVAERAGLSQSPCWRRIQRLRENGYIKAIVAIVDRQKLGFMMQIFAQVKMARLTDEARADLVRQVNSVPEILECYTVFGEMDVMMKVLAPDVVWYQEFVFSVIMKLPGVQEVRSIVTLLETKSTTQIPLKVRKLR
ncbi:MAG: Lrp/AsnC family transcriptional regulator [Gammaproteobacteria bacterium]|jgi:Lrp/AsnC family transcriptional regulator|nr:Lrp/AsnC family transcriptional regulator [Gammaproteobacteria bacterium]